jgi:homeobox protein cut-like
MASTSFVPIISASESSSSFSSSEHTLMALQDASRAWSGFDWSGQQASVQESLRQAKEGREQSLAARKNLAETTKQFKRAVKTLEQQTATAPTHSQHATTDDADDASAAPLPSSSSSSSSLASAVDALGRLSRSMVRSYQEEIDQLTRRCKSSESAFQHLASEFFATAGGRPDPAPLLRSASDQIQSQQSQISQLLTTVASLRDELEAAETRARSATTSGSSPNPPSDVAPSSGSRGSGSRLSKGEREELIQLRREVAEYEVEFRSLKNQDITIRKLEAKIVELQTSAQDAMAAQLELARQELAETEGRRAAEALEREAATERKAQTLELQLRAERAGREATQAHLLQADEGAGQREAAWEAQRRILVDDAERLREQLQLVTSERDELSMRVAAATSSSAASASKSKPGTQSLTPPPSSGTAPGGVSLADLVLERRAYEAEVCFAETGENLI